MITNGRPALIGGDFNTGEKSRQLKRIRKNWIDLFRLKNPNADGTTYTLRWPWGKPISHHRLDYLFLQPGSHNWQVFDARHLSSPELNHSDHQAVLARIAPLT
jgi:endonuclease/exonuclease/phosphatase (EEP) superfamily protein YafD